MFQKNKEKGDDDIRNLLQKTIAGVCKSASLRFIEELLEREF